MNVILPPLPSSYPLVIKPYFEIDNNLTIYYTVICNKVSNYIEGGNTMNVYICVGSSCHLKGSYDIIQLMKEAILEHNLEEQVTLSAAFCLGHCTDGVSVKIDEDVICGVSKDSFTEFFQTKILNKVIAK